MTNEQMLDTARRLCTSHRKEVLESVRCGCFCCLDQFPPTEIVEWTDGGETALCPRCGIDSVLPGNLPDIALDTPLLVAMQRRWLAFATQ